MDEANRMKPASRRLDVVTEVTAHRVVDQVVGLRHGGVRG